MLLLLLLLVVDYVLGVFLTGRFFVTCGRLDETPRERLLFRFLTLVVPPFLLLVATYIGVQALLQVPRAPAASISGHDKPDDADEIVRRFKDSLPKS